ncbi:MAG TPA: hypothetical protein VD928_01820 [Candidatus Paceibacterota bacterium]|nr:hypothetical protein [Candidatus Paceibacterota bacterium]
MKKTLLVVGLLLAPVVSFAAELRFGEQPSVSATEQIRNDVYMAGGSVTSAGAITGDLIAGGGNILVSGAVSADAIVGGGNVTILAPIGDDLRIGGGNIVIQNTVGGDIVAGGGQITIGGAGVSGDVVVGAGSVRIDAPVAGSVKIGSGSIYINAPITGTLDLEADSITLGRGAVINGTLNYKSSKELTREEGATVNGQINFTPREDRDIPAAALAALVSIWVLGKFLALLIAALVIGLVFKRFSRELVTRAVEQPFSEFARGLVTVIVLPVVSIILMVTLIGIPLGVIGLLSYFLLLIFGCLITPIIIGSVVHHYFTKRDWEVSWVTILIGVLVYTVLGFIPFIGWLIQVLVTLIAIGVLIGIRWQETQKWR